ncbi:MAG: hypothetical protein NTY96_10755 [Bacteroidetes bacterium]|nr:hypothetical protein [Bacteroidota bacterium]
MKRIISVLIIIGFIGFSPVEVSFARMVLPSTGIQKPKPPPQPKGPKKPKPPPEPKKPSPKKPKPPPKPPWP